MGSITRRNSTGESTEPWRTPRWMWNWDDTVPQTCTDDIGFVYHSGAQLFSARNLGPRTHTHTP